MPKEETKFPVGWFFFDFDDYHVYVTMINNYTAKAEVKTTADINEDVTMTKVDTIYFENPNGHDIISAVTRMYQK